MSTVLRAQMPRGPGGQKDINDFRGEPEAVAKAIQGAKPIKEPGPVDRKQPKAQERVSLSDFHAHMPDHRYIFAPTGDLWPASSIDSRLPWIKAGEKKIRPSQWLDQHSPVEQMIWVPGQPKLIQDRLMHAGGWVDHAGAVAYNLYLGATIRHGNPDDVQLWVDHVRRVYPADADHIIRWFAQRVQHPGVKVNHCLVLGGKQGVGKDTILEPLKQAVGPWNFQEVAPGAMLGRFNGFLKSVVLRVSEARDLGDLDRFAFYEHAKTLMAAPPDTLRCDEKNLREHYVQNVLGVVITTNNKSNGIYLPADDRRHFVAWSEIDRSEFDEGYWRRLWRWYERGGLENVAAYLAQLDLSAFDPKADPPKTEAFWHIVNAARAPEESELADILEAIGNPEALTVGMLVQQAKLGHPEFADWLTDRKNRKHVAYRLEDAGYESVRNQDAKDGLWKVDGRRVVVYARHEMTMNQRLRAVRGLTS